jgi:hypothetical protein
VDQPEGHPHLALVDFDLLRRLVLFFVLFLGFDGSDFDGITELDNFPAARFFCSEAQHRFNSIRMIS